jgi:hypothetical protein
VGVGDLDLCQLTRRAGYLIGVGDGDDDPVSVGVVIFGRYICIAIGQQRAFG